MLRAPNAPADRGAGSAATDVPVQPARAWSDASPAPAPDAKTKRDSPAVEACFALYQENRFDEVVAVGTEMLAKLGVQWPASGSHESAALWSVVGLAKKALGDDDRATIDRPVFHVAI